MGISLMNRLGVALIDAGLAAGALGLLSLVRGDRRQAAALTGLGSLLGLAGPDQCRVTTETRVHATDALSRRLFAAYWRLIYPGSSLIRVEWLRAIRKRAESNAGLSRSD